MAAAEDLAERPRVGRIMSDVSDAVLLPSPSPSRRRYSLVNLRDRVQRLYLGLPLVSEPGPSEGANAVTTSSPVNKRRVFSGRKWLPPPLRKLSGSNKVERNAVPERTLKKTSSDKRIKSPGGEMGNKQGQTSAVEEEVSRDQNGEEAEEEVVLPPPMKPISEPLLVPSDDTLGQRSSNLSLEEATSADLAEIEQIVKERMEQHTEKQSKLSVSDGTEGEEKALQKRVFAIREIVKTEQDYVRDLSLMVNGYIAHMRDPKCEIKMPEDLRAGKDKLVFGNIEQIYEWHRDFFLKALERCIEHPEEMGPLFKKYERKLYMHVLFCKNKPFSEYIVSEYIDTYFADLRQKMGHKHQLCDLLIMPVQRITRYPLLLKEVYKYTEQANLIAEAEALQQARQTMEDIAKAANDMMDISRLQGFDGKLASQGQLLFHGPMVCCEKTSTGASFKGKELQVFLFEQIIIFSEAEGKKTQYTSPRYKYKNHIQVNKMSLEERVEGREEKNSGGVELFCVRSTDPRKPALAYICQASTAEVRAEWIHSLRKLLQMQKDFLKAIQAPIKHQNELNRDPYTLSTSLRPHSPPLHEECPLIVSEPLSAKTKHQSNFLEGFRNTLRRAKSEAPEVESNVSLMRRWSDAHPNAAENESDLRKVRVVDHQSVLVSVARGSVECCDHETGAWRTVTTLQRPHGRIVPGLCVGHTYSFRVDGGHPLPSVTIPHESRWQQEQFERRYQQFHIIGRGRTAMVKLAQDRGTSQKVALKQVDRRKIPQCVTRAEYNLLTRLNHTAVLRGLALFENAPLPGVDTIVMELLNGVDVFSHACSLSSISEAHIRQVTSQLLGAIDYLQLRHVVHCDIKPDNLMIECHDDKVQLKIVDFGSAFTLNQRQCEYKRNLSLDLEFTAPELLNEPPSPSPSTDIWSCAVLVYVFISGVSPFLDDSSEETTAHILNADFSFPTEVFQPSSSAVQKFISSLLIQDPESRPLAHSVLSLPWLQLTTSDFDVPPSLLASFVNRRKPTTAITPNSPH